MADRGRDPETLEREIERTRQELAQTIDALADRLSPRNVAHRGIARVKEEAAHVAAAVGSLVAPTEPKEGETAGFDRRKAVMAGAGVAAALTVVVLWRRRRR